MTRSRPVIFFTVQKSRAANNTTTINVRISYPRKAFKKTNANIDAPLKPTWNIHATGLFAVEKSPSVKLYRLR